jgi:tetratricopeptide (TPR) repeat protein
MMGLRERLRAKASPESERETFMFLVLSILAFLPYANTLLNSFAYDDSSQVIENPYVHSFRYLREIFGTTVWSFQGAQGVTNYYRPLMTFGYLLAYQIAGAVPFSFHLANIVLNVVVVLLVFALLRRMSGERVALIATGLFALHPLHTESVAWIAGVTDLELAVFYLLTFLLYLRLPESGKGYGRRAAMCGSFALALLSKEQAMTLPVLVTLFEHFYRNDRATTSPREKVSRYAPLWAMAALYLVARGIMLGGVASVVSRPTLSWYEVGLSAVSLTGGYLWKLIWPAHLSAYYIFHRSSHITDRNVLLGLAGLALCGTLFVLLWRRAHLLSFAFVLIFLPLAPVLNARWMPASVFAERYLYLPSIGFCWLVGWAAVTFWRADVPGYVRPLCRAVPLLLVAVAFPYAMKTVARNRDWRTGETLFLRTLEQSDSSLIRTNLGAIYFNNGDLVGAEHEWLEALAAGPTNAFALDNLALLRQRQHRYVESLDYSWRALRARPQYMMGHLNLAETLAQMDRTAEAEWQYRIATAIAPLSTRAHNAYGEFLFDSERLQDAQAEYERSVHVDPTGDAYDRLGDIYQLAQDRARAEQAFRHALSLNAFDSNAHFGLGLVLEEAGRPGDALHEIESGLELDPSDPQGKAAVIRLRGGAPPQAIPR